jgi:propionate CoA-transferase
MELIEIAPGIDLETDILAHMDFRPIMCDVKIMNRGIFQSTWGALAELLAK